jgi:hypothetical protein
MPAKRLRETGFARMSICSGRPDTIAVDARRSQAALDLRYGTFCPGAACRRRGRTESAASKRSIPSADDVSRKAGLLAVFGTLVEYYDFSIYSYVASPSSR